MNLIQQLEAEQMGKSVPDFAPGDTVVVDVRVVEGTLAELQQGAAADPGRHDYVLARVTDPGAVLDVMAKGRAAG